jgi:glycine/D-amino acid oxidase-like deaminating enzyme
MTVDYIIVGQGLAGSAVAVQLLKRGKKVFVIDEPEKNNSSRIAAGLFNPITGKKMVKTWLADTLFPYLHAYYLDLQASSSELFFHPLPLYRPFINVEEQNEWMARSADPVYKPYLQQVFSSPSGYPVNDPHGGILLKQCGYLDTSVYVTIVSERIQSAGVLQRQRFDATQLRIGHDHVQYQDVEARKIIFCQGVHENPWFNWLPIRPLKGETISVESAFQAPIIFNRGIYAVPGRDGSTWRIGATYHLNDQEPSPTATALEELQTKSDELLMFPRKITGQAWGFRPTVPDRRPLLGQHPAYAPLIIFNGLGTKGVSLAPYFSEVLVKWLENNISINKLVDIERYKSLYSSSPK